MPERRGFIFSAVLHVAVLLSIVLGLPDLFEPRIEGNAPIAVELVNLAPETHATEKNTSPPVPHAKPVVARAAPPKPKPPEPQPAPPSPAPPSPAPAPPKPVPPKPVPPKPVPPKPAPPKPAPPKPQPAPPPPPPPPEEKPPPPKPAPPPPPRKPETKPPAPRPQKPNEASFNQLLKNLADRKLTQPPDQQAKGPPQKSSQPLASLASQLSTNEIDLVKRQIEACWNVPAGALHAKDLQPEFRVMMNPDGTVRAATLLNPGQLSNPYFQAAADSANRALLNPRCQPLKLPLDKYNQWQTFTITFDPKDVS